LREIVRGELLHAFGTAGAWFAAYLLHMPPPPSVGVLLLSCT
jgi:hypothetical protein